MTNSSDKIEEESPLQVDWTYLQRLDINQLLQFSHRILSKRLDIYFHLDPLKRQDVSSLFSLFPQTTEVTLPLLIHNFIQAQQNTTRNTLLYTLDEMNSLISFYDYRYKLLRASNDVTKT